MDQLINRWMKMAFGAFIRRHLKERIRRGSIQAVKVYLQAIKYARFGLMGLFGIGAAASIFVAGVVLTILGIVGLLPISATAMAVTTLVLGLLLAIGSGIGFLMLFSQKRWLEMSRSYELMESVKAPWSGVLPPNPVGVMKRNTKIRHDITDSTRLDQRPLSRDDDSDLTMSTMAASPVHGAYP